MCVTVVLRLVYISTTVLSTSFLSVPSGSRIENVLPLCASVSSRILPGGRRFKSGSMPATRRTPRVSEGLFLKVVGNDGNKVFFIVRNQDFRDNREPLTSSFGFDSAHATIVRRTCYRNVTTKRRFHDILFGDHGRPQRAGGYSLEDAMREVL